MRLASLFVLGSLVALVSGCKQSTTQQQCMTMGGPSDLVSQAALFKLDVYPDTVMCEGGDVPPGSVPTLSRTFKPGDVIKLDIPPGHQTIVLTTYADDAGTMEMGSGCTTTDLKPGGQVCINLTILPAPDIAVITDLSAEDIAVCSGPDCPCISSPDSCPAGEFCGADQMCQLGCKVNSDCNGKGPAVDGGLPLTTCNTTTHQCAECNNNSQCPLGKVCSPSGSCVIGCDASHACPGNLTCCNSLCVDTTSDPLNCGSCGNPCNVGGATTCCSSMCSDITNSPDNCGGCANSCSSSGVATRRCMTGQCKPVCNPHRADCSGVNDGCETDTALIANCGGCSNKCDVTSGHSSSALCNADGGFCTYSCTAPFADCDTNGADTNGCETNTNSDVNHCGGCLNSACDTTNSVPTACNTGLCTYSGCKNLHGDCNNTADPHNILGCETSVTSPTQCGACTGAACDTNNTSPPVCALDGGAAHCVYGCTGNFIDCNNAPPNTTGCEINKTTDTNNCTGCGIACDTTTGTPVCNGSRCSYNASSGGGSCNSGKADCDTSGTDTAGCECTTSTSPPDGGCCGTVCQKSHTNGIGDNYFDCTTPGATFDFNHAMRACIAHTGTATTCLDFSCPGGNDRVVCDNSGSGKCDCWDYSAPGHTGSAAGEVDPVANDPNSCGCPTGSWPAQWHWN